MTRNDNAFSESVSEKDPEVFYSKLKNCFSQAAAQSRYQKDFSFHLGTSVVRLSFAAESLFQEFRRAFGHLEISTQKSPDLTIHLCDNLSSGISLPAFPWRDDQLKRRGDILIPSDKIRLFYSGFIPALSLYHAKEKTAFYWTEDGSRLPSFETAAPLRVILHWHALENESLLIHGAGIGLPQGGVLLAGRGGLGKSTSSLACLLGSLGFAGDDYVLVDLKNTRLYSLYSSAKLAKHQIEQCFPELANEITNNEAADEEKRIVFLDTTFRGSLIRGFPLKALLIPEITTAKEANTEVLAPVKAVLGAAPSTLLQMPGAGSHELKKVSELIQRLPCYRLKIGSNLNSIPAAIRKIIEAHGEA